MPSKFVHAVFTSLVLRICLSYSTGLQIPDNTATTVLRQQPTKFIKSSLENVRTVEDNFYRLPPSPANLLKPDGFQFYTYNERGDMITRQMTMQEIQALIAGGGPDHSNIAIQEPQKVEDTLTGGKKVIDVVEKVQSVLKSAMDKPLSTLTGPHPTIPEKANVEWSNILPAILAGDKYGSKVEEHQHVEESTTESDRVSPVISEETQQSNETISQSEKNVSHSVFFVEKIMIPVHVITTEQVAQHTTQSYNLNQATEAMHVNYSSEKDSTTTNAYNTKSTTASSYFSLALNASTHTDAKTAEGNNANTTVADVWIEKVDSNAPTTSPLSKEPSSQYTTSTFDRSTALPLDSSTIAYDFTDSLFSDDVSTTVQTDPSESISNGNDTSLEGTQHKEEDTTIGDMFEDPFGETTFPSTSENNLNSSKPVAMVDSILRTVSTEASFTAVSESITIPHTLPSGYLANTFASALIAGFDNEPTKDPLTYGAMETSTDSLENTTEIWTERSEQDVMVNKSERIDSGEANVTSTTSSYHVWQRVSLHQTTKGTGGLDTTTGKASDDIVNFSRFCNELAIKFWIAVNKGLSTGRSLALSPFGMISLLAMIFLGARGSTSDQMNEILGLDNVATFNPHLIFQNVTDTVSLARHQGIANAAFVREVFADKVKVRKLLPFYKEQVQQFYEGLVAEVNFATISDLVRRRTNLLVRKQTGGRIKDFVKSNAVPLRSPLAAISANVFETDCNGSSSSLTGRDGELYFAVSSAQRLRKLIPVPATVWRSNVLAGYEPSLDATAIAIGGAEKVVSTIFLVPGQQGHIAAGDTLDRLEQQLVKGAFREGGWNKILKVLIPRPGLELQLPKFSHRSVVNATAALKRMGLEELFSKEADLKGINGIGNRLFLSDVLQMNVFGTCGEENVGNGRHHVEVYPGSGSWRRYFKREIDIDTDIDRKDMRSGEKGRLKLDQPFLYVVRHNPTGLLLHMGRFNPRLV